MNKKQYSNLINEIHHLMDVSMVAYRNYQQNGQKFSYAKDLRKCNTEMIQLLEKNELFFSEELKIAAAALLEHYSIWRNKWDALKESMNPKEDDVFTFPNEHTFPKWAAHHFEVEYKKIML
ncbi:MAG: hypothetical protein JST23_10490 [Bacteroidetes bacterium]|nr:hypothetical protein [Bacteroidota bacterium]